MSTNQNITTNDAEQHPFVGFVRGLRHTSKIMHAIKMPMDESDYIWTYGILSFNVKNGLFTYGSRKPIQHNEHLMPFKIISLLFKAQGKEVLYKTFAEELNIPFKTAKERRIARNRIRQVCKQTRRTLGIDALSNPEENPFVMSGKGIKLALIL